MGNKQSFDEEYEINPDHVLSYQEDAVVCLLLGIMGTGKSTLVNKLCHLTGDLKIQTGAAKTSLTMNVFKRQVGSGDCPNFWVIDTPGMNSSIDKFKHAILQKAAFSHTKLNTIFVLVQYQDRIDEMVQKYEETIKPLRVKDEILEFERAQTVATLRQKLISRKAYETQPDMQIPEELKQMTVRQIESDLERAQMPIKKYCDMIALIVTKFDHADDDDAEQMARDITYVFSGQDKLISIEPSPLTPNKILFSTKHVDGDEMANNMFDIARPMPKMKLQYSEEDFYESFNLAEWDKNLKKKKAKFDRDLNHLLKSWIYFIETACDSKDPKVQKDIASVYYTSIIQMTQEHQDLRNKFLTEIESNLNALNHFAVHTEITEKVFNQIENLKDILYQRTKVADKPEDKVIRKCPYCGEVWVKVSGCDGNTRCGSIETVTDKQIEEGKTFYYVRWRNTNSDYTDYSYDIQSMSMLDYCKQKYEETAQQAKAFVSGSWLFGETVGQTASEPSKKKQAGCNARINWKECPPLSSEELKQLYETVPGLREFIRAQAPKKFRQQFAYNSKKFDTKIY